MTKNDKKICRKYVMKLTGEKKKKIKQIIFVDL